MKFSLFLLFFVTTLSRAADIPAIAAAADLQFALTEITEKFKQETGQAMKLTFGSSGNFTQQIEHGAPFQLFLSADEAYIFRLADRGMTVDQGELYAIGRLVLFAPHGSSLKVDEQLRDLKTALTEGQGGQGGRVTRFAIANPDHAPYGRAARAVLQQAGVWDAIRSKLVLGENATQAMQFAAMGSSQGGIVPLSLSKAPQIAKLGQFVLLPAQAHETEPLRQRMVLLKNAGVTARNFYHYLRQPTARNILDRYGFTRPSPPTPLPQAGEGSFVSR
ncbi:MAG: molybdate ABC transporter substrate-binding protein [Rhodocyclaceae bacterium]|nr:molybdate ABC transporter substrate-binding protein [Rhodocyclaceae bacterium]